MRTSRTSKETAKVLQALSPPARRQTRSSANTSVLRSFAFGANSANDVDTKSSLKKSQSDSDDDISSLSSADTVDIEDILEPPSKRRRSNVSAQKTSSRPRPSSTKAPEKTVVKDEPVEAKPSAPKTRRVPARKIKGEDGSVKVEPPSNWETMYSIVKKMREDNPTAPVDTMGCAELYWRGSSPRDKRFQTLIALMMSSQTKDTVTAVAMQRLHTELGDGEAPSPESTVIKKEEDENKDSQSVKPFKDSTLNLENILAVSPERLNELIRTVGFHNNKTKYIKAAAIILRDQYDSDIPSTAQELMKLPGVGPKMAFLCMSAAWGKHEGIGVDVHVHRITNLWGWNKTKAPEETRMALESWLPKDKWHEINKLLVGLGQTVCLPVGRRCGDCDLAGTKLCKSEIKGMTPKIKKPKAKEEVEEKDFSGSAVAKIKIEEELPGARGYPARFSALFHENTSLASSLCLETPNNPDMEYLLDSDDEAFANMLMEAWLTSPEPETPNDTDTSSNDTPPETSDKAITPFRKPRITFLDLPDHVRLRIYQYSGLFRQRCITFFNYEKMRKINSKELDTCALRAGKRESSGFWYSPYVIHCDHPAFPMGVFLASRAIRLDIVPHFFGLNNFAIDICCGADFRLFCTATERGYQYLKSLHIDLRPGDNRYLKIGSGVHRTIMNAWDSFLRSIRYLSFKFPLTCRVAARPGHKPEDSALLSWSVLRRFIREHFDLERLSLMIVDLGTKQSFPNATPNRNKYLRKLLKSFADLRGLRDFRVYLADDRIFERDAEKAVLGPERAGRSKLDVMPFIGQKHLSSSD
ncbi:DNA N-glycosylase and apurinic/apyrimidinic (AP) lyase [Aspergillus wentii]|nr:DNA N-glycosylase and apurinic/apyrimidinic (AP) lyase [Aspergillus wentii]